MGYHYAHLYDSRGLTYEKLRSTPEWALELRYILCIYTTLYSDGVLAL